MGRYTSVQSYSDQNTKLVTGYKENSGGDGVKKTSAKVERPEKIENVMGSTAGAGSGEFHMYLNAKHREERRIQSMEIIEKNEEETRVFAEKVVLF
jgi:hypothetical protein